MHPQIQIKGYIEIFLYPRYGITVALSNIANLALKIIILQPDGRVLVNFMKNLAEQLSFCLPT